MRSRWLMFRFIRWYFCWRLMLALLSLSSSYSSDYLMVTSLAYVSFSSLVFSLTSSVGFVIFIVNLFVGFFDGYFVGLCFGFFVGTIINVFRWLCYLRRQLIHRIFRWLLCWLMFRFLFCLHRIHRWLVRWSIPVVAVLKILSRALAGLGW